MARTTGSLTKTANKNVKQFLSAYPNLSDLPKWLATMCGNSDMRYQALRVLDVITLPSVGAYVNRWREANLKEMYSPSMVEHHTREIRKLSVLLNKELPKRQQAAYTARDEALVGTTGCLLNKSQKRRVELLAANYDKQAIDDFVRRVLAQLKGNQV